MDMGDENPEKPDQLGKGTSSEPDNESILNDLKSTQPLDCNILEAKQSAGDVIFRKAEKRFQNGSGEGIDIIELPATGNPTTANEVKSLDPNRYATKKTIAQGMLDIALLTANASQLKYILQIGKQHEFYTLMLTLICLSIGLQILSGLLSLSLNLMLDRKMEEAGSGLAVEWIGRLRVALSFIVFLDNILIAAFDPMGLSSIVLFDNPLQGVEMS